MVWVTVTRQQDARHPNDSKYVLKIQTSSASPQRGFYFGAKCGYRKVLVTAHAIAKIPGRNLCWATNSVGTGGSAPVVYVERRLLGDWKTRLRSCNG